MIDKALPSSSFSMSTDVRYNLEVRKVEVMERIAVALEKSVDVQNAIVRLLNEGTIKVKDVDRAKVYSEHLGEKLRP